MTLNPVDNPSAFPRPVSLATQVRGSWDGKSGSISSDPHIFGKGDEGMTLRDYYAGQALVGLLASIDTQDPDSEHIGKLCFMLADGLIKARSAHGRG